MDKNTNKNENDYLLGCKTINIPMILSTYDKVSRETFILGLKVLRAKVNNRFTNYSL